MMRRGDDPKLSPEEEQALLEKLRRQRDAKAAAMLQAEVQSLSAKMVQMDLIDVLPEAKKLSTTEKVFASSPTDAQVSIVVNALLRSCAPPPKTESPTKGKGGGGGKKQARPV